MRASCSDELAGSESQSIQQQKLNDRLDDHPDGLNVLDEIDAIADRMDLNIREKWAAIIRMLRPWVRADRTI